MTMLGTSRIQPVAVWFLTLPPFGVSMAHPTASLLSLLEDGTDRPHVPASEYACVRADLPLHFRRGTPSSHQAFDAPGGGIKVSATALLSVLDAVAICAPTAPVQRAVVVHYGLTQAGNFDVRLQALCLTYSALEETYKYPDSTDCFEVESNGSLSLIEDGMIAWRDEGGGWFNYEQNVVVMHDNSGRWAELDPQRDLNAMIFPENALRDLIAHNGLGNGQLALVPIATPEERTVDGAGGYIESGFRQGVAWLPVDVQLDDTTYPGQPFRAKAANLGSPCPPNFPHLDFSFPARGTVPRDDCK